MRNRLTIAAGLALLVGAQAADAARYTGHARAAIAPAWCTWRKLRAAKLGKGVYDIVDGEFDDTGSVAFGKKGGC